MRPSSPMVEYEELPAILDAEAALPTGVLVTDPLTLRRGDAQAAIAAAPRRLAGRMRIGGQEHFYLEGQIALAVPGEDDEVTVYSSTQHPSEIQHMVAKVLDVPRTPSRSRSAAWAAASAARRPRATCSPASCAIVAKKTGRAAKLRPDRDDDMVDHRQAPRFRGRLRGRLRR